MRHLSLIAIVLIQSCGSDASIEDRNDSIANSNTDNGTSLISSHELPLRNTIVLKDLNGDRIEDQIRYVDSGPENGKIQIKLGGDSIWYLMKFESENGEMIEDFNWVDSWGVHSEKTIHVTYTIDGELHDSTFTLENPAIKLWQDGGGSGFFTFKGGKWIWLTTGC